MPLGSRSAMDHPIPSSMNPPSSVMNASFAPSSHASASQRTHNLIEQPISNPWRYIIRMIVFLGLIGFLGYILQGAMHQAFMANPALNGLMAGVLCIGILLSFTQVLRLFREVKWVKGVQTPSHPFEKLYVKPPILLSPMVRVLEQENGKSSLSPTMLRTLLDSIASRLDESREMTRYLGGLLIFLGLLGTFWGLLETVGSIGKVIGSMRSGGESATLFDELKAGLAQPLAGMGVSFSSSLFGLAGSLIVGFLDLQAGQAHRLFYTQIEDWLSVRVREDVSASHNVASQNAASGEALFARLEHVLTRNMEQFQTHLRATTASGDTTQSTARAIVHLAESVGGMVQQMRHEQQLIRDWVEAQAAREQSLAHDLKTLIAQVVLIRSSEQKTHLQNVPLQGAPIQSVPASPQHVHKDTPSDAVMYDDTLSRIEALVSDVYPHATHASHSFDHTDQKTALHDVFADQTRDPQFQNGLEDGVLQHDVSHVQKREGL